MNRAKRIFLDTNKWIDLGKAYHGLHGGEKYKTILQKIESKLAGGEIVLPVSFVQILETWKNLNRERRKRLATVVARLSNALFLLPPDFLRPLEIQNAVARLIGKSEIDLYERAVGRGAAYAFGRELKAEIHEPHLPQDEERLNEIFKGPEVFEQILIDGMDEQDIKRRAEAAAKLAEKTEELRKNGKEKHFSETYVKTEMLKFITDDYILADWIAAEKHFGRDLTDLFPKNWTPEEFMDFLHSIPTIDVFFTLYTIRDEQVGRPIRDNDVYDIGFLAVAVPYCDIVVLEKFFADLIKRSGLAKKWDTIVVTDLRELENYL
jgi:hypothetical protein